MKPDYGKIWVSNGAQKRDTRDESDGYVRKPATGIDFFNNVLRHERRHVFQMKYADGLLKDPDDLTKTKPAPPGTWSWKVTVNDPRYNHKLEDGTDFDFDHDSLPNDIDNAPMDDQYGVEEDAQAAEGLTTDQFASLDWGDHGKQHGKAQDGAGNRYDDQSEN